MTVTSERTTTGRSPSPPAPWRRLILRLHFYAGILVGPFLLVAALTGVGYAVTPQLESWVYAEQLRAPVADRPLPLAEQVGSALDADPAGTLVAVPPAPDPGDTTRVLFEQDGLDESERRTLFVDPGTAEITGDLPTYGTSGVLPLRTTLDQLHRNLLLGEPGRLYSELAASWLAVVAVGGLVLWASQRRTTARASGRRRTLRVHGGVGVGAVVGLLFLSATGLTWSTYAGENVSSLRAAVGWSTPELATGSGHAGHGGHHDAGAAPAGPSQVEEVLATARGAGIDARQVEIALPTESGGPWTVTEIQRSWPTQVDAVAVDAASDQVVDEVRFADFPVVAKLARWGIDAHMGVLFGPISQLAVAALGLGLATLVVLGYRMWWQRRPTGRTVGRPAPRGQWRRIPPGALVALGVSAVAVGWFAPLLGISLLAFLLIDAVLAWRSRSRAPASWDVPPRESH